MEKLHQDTFVQHIHIARSRKLNTIILNKYAVISKDIFSTLQFDCLQLYSGFEDAADKHRFFLNFSHQRPILNM